MIADMVEKREYKIKSMRLRTDTEAVYNSVKNSERYTDGEMMDYLLSGLLYLNQNKVKFSGFNKGKPREAVFKELLHYYDGLV